jgi:hypothetical protein
MALSRRAVCILVLFLVVSFCKASFLDTLRQTILGAFIPSEVETATATPEQVIDKPKREGKRVAIIGTYPILNRRAFLTHSHRSWVRWVFVRILPPPFPRELDYR